MNKKRSYSWFCNSMLNALVVLAKVGATLDR